MKVLLCKDFGENCPAVFQGESVEDVLRQAKEHGMTVHGQTREQVEAPKVRRIAEEKSRDK